MPGLRSRNKGKDGEREFANFLKEHGFEDAKRGVQYKGTKDSPDVEGLDGYHIEVKRCEALRLYDAIEKADDDSGTKIPIVAHRRNRKPWVVILRADDFLQVIKNDD